MKKYLSIVHEQDEQYNKQQGELNHWQKKNAASRSE